MALASKGSAPPIFDFKSASLPLVALVLKTADLSELRGELQSRLGDTPQFFSHDPVLLDLSAVREAAEPGIDFAGLIELMRSYRMNPVGVRGGSAEQHAAALEAGLAEVTVDEAASSMSTRPCVARRLPGRVAIPMRAYTQPAWRLNWSPSPAHTALPRIRCPMRYAARQHKYVWSATNC